MGNYVFSRNQKKEEGTIIMKNNYCFHHFLNDAKGTSSQRKSAIVLLARVVL
jgi:hypothetical protein